ncbi:MAG: DUF308 domain-containing protein [Alphaproteobacteria bacterium]
MDMTKTIPAAQAFFFDLAKLAPPLQPSRLITFGALLVGLGSIAFVSVTSATMVSVYLVAIGMMMAGGAEITLGLQSRSWRNLPIWGLLGALYLGAGLFAFFNPLMAASVLTLGLGLSLVGAGVVRLALSLVIWSESIGLWIALSSLFTTLLGIMVLAQWPASSLFILGIFLSVNMIFAGMGWIMIGVAALSHPQARTVQTP